MKKRNVLALALAAGLVLGGANTAHAMTEKEYQDAVEKAYAGLIEEKEQEKTEDQKAEEDYQNAAEKEYEKLTKEDEKTEDQKAEEDYQNAVEKEYEKLTKEDEKTDDQIAEEKYQKEYELAAVKEAAIAELKEAGITSDFFLNQIRKAKTVEGVETLKNELLKSHADSNKEEEKPGKEDGKKVVIPGYKIEDIAKPSKEDKENGTYKPGYATREEAEKAAKEALKNIKTKDSYTIFEDADGRFGYYLWSKADEEEAEKAAKIKEASKENEKAKEGKASTPAAKSSNPNAAPKTGVAGISAVAGLAAVSVAGIIATRKKED